MSDPVYRLADTVITRTYAQWWGPVKLYGRTQDECLAEMTTTGGLEVRAYCPRDLIPEVLAAYTELLDGVVPPATHVAVWTFGEPTFIPICGTTEGVEGDDDE